MLAPEMGFEPTSRNRRRLHFSPCVPLLPVSSVKNVPERGVVWLGHHKDDPKSGRGSALSDTISYLGLNSRTDMSASQDCEKERTIEFSRK